MALFDAEQQDTLKLVLGYASVPNLLTTQLADARSQVTLDYALSLVDQLAAIDTKLSEATADSMAVGVGKLSLSYRQHVAHLKSEGNRLLLELGTVLGIQVFYNKYRSSTSLATRSYW
jgi:hypothetical protein